MSAVEVAAGVLIGCAGYAIGVAAAFTSILTRRQRK